MGRAPRSAAALTQRREDWLTVLTLVAVAAGAAAVFAIVPGTAA